MKYWYYGLPLMGGGLLRAMGVSNGDSFLIVVAVCVVVCIGVFIHYEQKDTTDGPIMGNEMPADQSRTYSTNSEFSEFEDQMSMEEGREHLKNVSGTFSVWNLLVPPLGDQIRRGLEGRDIPTGGFFDDYVRGYYYGYVDRFMENAGQTSIVTNLSGAHELFGIIFGSVEDGETSLNECLMARADAINQIGAPFHRGRADGSGDLEKLVSGETPRCLEAYLRTIS